MIIVGAGMAGLLAGALDRKANVFEAQPELPHNHHAVLRFREDKIAKALDIPFRKVRVLKGVSGSMGPIADANAYSQKVTGRIAARSILNLEPVDRFIAPPDFISQMAEMLGSRLRLGTKVTTMDGKRGQPILSTIPLNATAKMLGLAVEPSEFQFAAVRIFKYRVPKCDAFQTVYFPYASNLFYRATLTGDELLLESACTRHEEPHYHNSVADACSEFQIDQNGLQLITAETQSLGKIVPLPDARRKALLLALTVEHGVFSLGRYACWRNLLLDDVFDDYYKVRKMMALDSMYDFRRSV